MPSLSPEQIEKMVQSRKKKEEHLATLITENQFNFPTTLISGIYAIFCISTNKVYFGKSVNVRGRMLKHKRCLRQGIHINKRLLRAFRKYGESQFIFCLVESVVPELLSKRERHYIMHYKSFRDYYGFNIKKVL